jgi:hypothetical protein
VLLLRLALAAKAAGDGRAGACQRELAARFDAARQRGDTSHRKEEARFALALQGDAARALPLARRNFAVQREPADARVLLEAALAAREPAAAEPALDWMAARHRERGAAPLAAAGEGACDERHLSRHLLVAVACLLWPRPALAHKPSDSYLTPGRATAHVTGRWDIALRDLDFALGLDADGDGRSPGARCAARHADIAAYALARLVCRPTASPVR